MKRTSREAIVQALISEPDIEVERNWRTPLSLYGRVSSRIFATNSMRQRRFVYDIIHRNHLHIKTDVLNLQRSTVIESASPTVVQHNADVAEGVSDLESGSPTVFEHSDDVSEEESDHESGSPTVAQHNVDVAEGVSDLESGSPTVFEHSDGVTEEESESERSSDEETRTFNCPDKFDIEIPSETWKTIKPTK
jgi:hypothetical protein